MRRFDVQFVDREGGAIRRLRVSAHDAQSVAPALGVRPEQVLIVDEAPSARSRRVIWRRAGSLHRLNLRLFSQELAVLLDAGIPLLESIRTLNEKEPQEGRKAMLEAIGESLEQGLPLSAALRRFPESFDELACAIVAANERSGLLADALARHARYLGMVEALRARLVTACVYPALLLAAGVGVILFLVLYVLPRFAGVLDGLGDQVPWASRQLIRVGQAAGQEPALVLLAFAGVALAVAAGWRHRGLRSGLAQMSWRLPGVGPRLRTIALARLYRCLAMLLAAGVPALPALRIAAAVMPSAWRGAVNGASAAVEQGHRLSSALDQHGLATPVARRMLGVGERSGELARMLEQAASFHDEEAAQLAELAARAINPALMLIMGLLVGGIIVLMYLPIFQLVEQVQ